MVSHPCPCGTSNDYLTCCGLYISNKALPKTPEALMRSRYTAYTRANIDYIKKTMQGKPLMGFNEIEITHWAKSVQWLGLNVIKAHQDPADKHTGFVEFIATFVDKGAIQTIHEISQFKLINGCWFYVDGK